jgi:malate/lactate dehydrogenase
VESILKIELDASEQQALEKSAASVRRLVRRE